MRQTQPLEPTGAPKAIIVLILGFIAIWAAGYFYTHRATDIYEEPVPAGTKAAPAPPAAAQTGLPPDLLERIMQHEAPRLDLQARMWAHSVKSGQTSLETLEYYSRDWIMAGSHRDELFSRIRRDLAIGDTAPLTREERALVDADSARTRQMIEEYLTSPGKLPPAPRIYADQDQRRLFIPEGMLAAIKKDFPDFRPFEEKDFNPTVRAGERFGGVEAPQALILDINSDKTFDLVVAGTDPEKLRVLAVLSTGAGYTASEIYGRPAEDPARVESLYAGKKEYGIDFGLWLDRNAPGFGGLFTIAFPPQTDENNELLADTVMMFGLVDGRLEQGDFQAY